LLDIEHTPDLVKILPASRGLLQLGNGLFNDREAGAAFAFLDYYAEPLPDGLFIAEAAEVVWFRFSPLADDQDADLRRPTVGATSESSLSRFSPAATPTSAAFHFSSRSSNVGPKTGTPP
jgi:hypothetical protein